MARATRIILAALVASFLASGSHAEIIGDAISISAEEGGRFGSYSVGLDSGSFDSDGNYFWSLDGPVVIQDGDGEDLAIVEHVNVSIIEDPVVSLSFVVTSLGTATSFSISSPLLSFPTIPNAEARVSAEIGVTDIGGDGASLTGMLAGGTKSYSANYDGAFPGGTVFAELVGNTSTGIGFGSVTISENAPNTGFMPIGSVSDMSTSFEFTIGSLDSASGTSVFVTRAVPEAGTFGMLGVAMAFGLGWRRRRS